MKVAVPLAKNISAPLRITAAASSIDAWIQIKIHDSGTPSFIITNEEMNDIMKIVEALEILIFYWKESLKQLKIKQKNRKEGLRNVIRYFRS